MFGSSLLYDASEYIFTISIRKKVIFHPDLRHIGFAVLHYPSVFYINYIGNDLLTLSRIFEITHVSIPLICLLFNYFTLPKEKVHLAIYHAIGLFLCFVSCFLCHVSELIPAISFLWIAATQLLCKINGKRFWMFILFFVLANGCYPLPVLVSPFLIAFVFSQKLEKKYAWSLYFILVSSIIFQIYAINLYREIYTGNYNNFFQGYKHYVLIRLLAVNFSMALVTSLFCLWKPKMKLVGFVFSALLNYFVFMELNWFDLWMPYAGRTFATIICAGFIIIVIFVLVLFPEREKIFLRSFKFIAYSLFFSLLFMEFSFLKKKKDYLYAVKDREGLIEFEKFPAIGYRNLGYLSTSHAVTLLFILWNSPGEIKYIVLDEKGSSSFFRKFGIGYFLDWTTEKGIKYSDKLLLYAPPK